MCYLRSLSVFLCAFFLLGAAPYVKTTKVKKVPITKPVQVIGSLTMVNDTTITSETKGRVMAIFVKNNQTVKKGDLLYQIDPQGLQKELEKAKGELALAKYRVKEYQTLKKSSFASKDRYLQAKTQLDIAQSNLQNLQERLALTKITAPFDGIIGLRIAHIGDYVDVGQPLIHLSNTSKVRLDFYVPSNEVNNINIGDWVSVKLTAYPDTVFKAKIYAINNVISKKNRMLKVRALLTETDKKLLSGHVGMVTIDIKHKEAGLVVPLTAVDYRSDGAFVYRVDKDKVQEKKVKLGRQMKNNIIIIDGVTENETVVSEGRNKLHNGAKIKILP